MALQLAASTANVLDEHEKAEEVTRRGLKLRPNAPNLPDRRAYALVGLDKLNEAEVILAKLTPDAPSWTQYIAEANRGLIAFRRGKTHEGRSRYQKAIDGFQQIGQAQMALSAKTYFCRELARLGLPDGEKMLETCVVL